MRYGTRSERERMERFVRRFVDTMMGFLAGVLVAYACGTIWGYGG